MAALVLAALPACREASGPVSLEGTYQMAEVNTQVLPYDDALGCCIFTAGSLTLGMSTYGVSITVQNKSNGMVGTLNESGTYTANGASLVFQPTGGDFAMHLFNAQVMGRTIRVQLGGDGPGAADQFAAVFRR